MHLLFILEIEIFLILCDIFHKKIDVEQYLNTKSLVSALLLVAMILWIFSFLCPVQRAETRLRCHTAYRLPPSWESHLF